MELSKLMNAVETPERAEVPTTPEPVIVVPAWARRHVEGAPLNHPNFVLRRDQHPQPQPQRAASSPPNPPQAQRPPSRPAPPSAAAAAPPDAVCEMIESFLSAHVLRRPDAPALAAHGVEWEIEAKLGLIIDRNTEERILGGGDETVLTPTAGTAFRSSMTARQHSGLNQYLNKCVETKPPPGSNVVPWHYAHTCETDRFLELPPDLLRFVPECMLAQIPRHRRPKLRATYNSKTGEPLGRIVKARVADLDISLPHRPLDCRISINLEMPWRGPTDEIDRMLAAQRHNAQSPDRRKDRLSYRQFPLQIDLTQVTQESRYTGKMELEHELEIELDSAETLKQARRAAEGRENRYAQLVRTLVERARKLSGITAML